MKRLGGRAIEGRCRVVVDRDFRIDLPRFIVTYRWELWLVIGIPAIAIFARNFVFHPLDLLLGLEEQTVTLHNLKWAQGLALYLLLLFVSYLRVRRLGREFLALLWGIAIILPAISLVAYGFVYVLGLTEPVATITGNVTSFSSSLGRAYLIAGIREVPPLLALLWFARQASRLSLTHAFFLVAFTALRPWDPVHWNWSLESIPYVYVTVLIGVLITYSIMLLKVWLVGNFDLRGPAFRRNTLIGLVAAIFLSGYVRVLISQLIGPGEGRYLSVPSLASYFESAYDLTIVLARTGLDQALIAFALVYLVRVRVSAADARADGAG